MSMPLPAATPGHQQALDRAVHLRLQGRLADAETLLLTVIEQDGAQVDALRLLGVIALQLRRPEQGLQLIERALALAPEHPVCHCSRGAALVDLQRWEEAVASFERAIALQPGYAAAHGNLGVALSQLGRFEEAESNYRQAIDREPGLADVHASLGTTLARMGRWDEAVASCLQALALRPGFPAALECRGNALLRLGRPAEALADFHQVVAAQPDSFEAHCRVARVAQDLQQLDDATRSYAKAVALNAADAQVWSDYGDALRDLARYEEAIDCYNWALGLRPAFAEAYCQRAMARLGKQDSPGALADFDRALAIRPDYFRAIANRGIALMELERAEEAFASFRAAEALGVEDPLAYANFINAAGALSHLRRYEESIEYCDKALALRPHAQKALFNRAHALHELNRLEEAIASYRQCVALHPDSALTKWGHALSELTLGRFQQGLPLYEWRRQLPDAMKLPPGAVWTGREDLVGKTIMVHGEQGLGDTLQFIRYTRLLRGRGAHVIAAVHAPLLSLLRSSDPYTTYIDRNRASAQADFHCALLSLPHAFGTRSDTIPAWPGYLRADPALSEAWKKRLPPRSRPRIGLAWSGNADNSLDYKRSLLLEQLQPVLSFAADWYVLQKGIRAADQPTLAALPQLTDFGDALSGFANTAALIDQLDLVITVDTSVAHLAGALGKPAWILLAKVPDWRWQLEREDSPWYPSARLFRQSASGDWASVVTRVRDALAAQHG